MSIGIGIDIGSVSVKVAVIGSKNDESFLRNLASKNDFFSLEYGQPDDNYIIVLSAYKRIKGRPLDAVKELLEPVSKLLSDYEVFLSFTGSGAKLAALKYDAPVVNEFSAIVEAVNHCRSEIRTVFEIGGETSKYILLDYNSESKKLSIIDYGTNGDCAAGTGAFMDQQASRLKYKIEDVGKIVINASKAAQIAGRCSVFAKSDMIHSQQRGYQPDEVLRGLCNAVARNFKSVISRGKKLVPPILFIGGVSQNEGMVRAIKEVFALDERDIIVPKEMCWLSAIGAALKAIKEKSKVDIVKKDKPLPAEFPYTEKLSLENVLLLRNRVGDFSFPPSGERVKAYIGIDIGSVSTNLVVIDIDGNVIKEIYTRTNARPIEVVNDGLKEIEREIGKKIEIIGAGTTGSGRELIGILIGADTINDEITAHKTGALHISRTMLGSGNVDTIFEIGGQDSKYISIEDGIVVDFTMNDACAAGTGSFLEEQAEDLGVKIINEFSELALSSEHPIRLGERCTVFMGRDVYSYMHRGALKKDVIAGLTYSVVHNYLNRVVGDRKIGSNIFFQGGTAYNDSVAAAFAKITGKKIVVPPYNGVIGAIGVALLAKRKMDESPYKTSFKGFDINRIQYELKEFTCKGCTNFCTVQEFDVDGEKTYWGDKCSERYRKKKKINKVPVITDLNKFREGLLKDFCPEDRNNGPLVGIPFTMYTFDLLPFFHNYLTECGFSVVLSDSTNTAISNMGIESIVSEPCYPITIAHGHIKNLLEKGVEFIFVPNVINSETEMPQYESYVCVWGSTLPFVLEHSPAFHPFKQKFLKPTLHFRDGEKIIKKELFDYFKKLGITKKISDKAVDKAYLKLKEFKKLIADEGKKAFEIIKNNGDKSIVLIGRPYNLYDKDINLSVASKLSTIYGINVIPMEFLDIDGIDISHINRNMYWNYGKKILQTAVKLSEEPNFDVIYITNFKCGPDSFIKHFVRDAIGKPFLILQFDGHSNDAGMMTRCEAYLDSKGFLKEANIKK